MAKGVLEGVKQTVRAGAEAAKFVVRLGLGGIINIKKIEFDVKIGLVESGHFSGTIVVSFLRKTDVTLSFTLQFESVENMASDLANAIFPGITGRRKREVEETLRRHMPDYSRRHYMPEMYIYKPGSAAEYRPKREYQESIYEKTVFVARKRSLTDELQAEKKTVELNLVEMHNRVLQFARPSGSATAAPGSSNQAKLLRLDQLKQTLGKP